MKNIELVETVNSNPCIRKPEYILNTPQKVITYLNKMAERKFRTTTESHITRIENLLKRGYSYQEIVLVIEFMVKKWGHKDETIEWLRPSILFDLFNFKNYLEKVRQIQGKELAPINSNQRPAA